MPDSTNLATVHPIAEGRPALELNTPFAHLMPPHTEDEQRALDADLQENGQDSPVLIDEESNILDGHSRYALLDGRVFTKTITGLTIAEKEAFVFRKAEARRNLSPDQRNVLREQMRAVAFRLRAEDQFKNTQQRVADKLGVSRSTVRDWFASAGADANPGDRPDARVKFTTEQREEAVRRVIDSGEKQDAVAAELGMSRQSVSRAVVETKRRIVGVRSEPAPPAHRPSRHHDHSAELKATVVRRVLADNESRASVRADLGLTAQALTAILEEHELSQTATTDAAGRYEGTRRFDKTKRDQAVLELHNQDLSSVEIAVRLGMPPAAVSKSKVRLGIAENSPAFKLWNDVVHAADSLAGSALALEMLTTRIESNELQATQEEIGECCKSLSESIRTAKRLVAALKAKTS